MEKLIKVFFASDLLPYKDKERTVHFPITGSAFLGASNTTKIRFYFDYIGNENTTWVSVAKLPNGKQGSKVLSVASDEDGNYAELQLSNWYTQAKGDVFIALQGYQGGVEYTYDSETELYEVYGTPTIQTTGSIKLAINYAPIGQVADYNDEFSTYQQILALLGSKADITSVAIYIGNIEDETYPTYQALFDYVGLRPFIAFYDGKLCMFHFVEHDTEPTTYSLREVSPYGVFETDTLDMTDSVLPTNEHCLLDTENCVVLSGGPHSGTINDIDAERLSKDNAIIKNLNEYYMPKIKVTNPNIKLFSGMSMNTYYEESGSYSISNTTFTIDLSEKTWTRTQTTIKVYTKEKLYELLALKADKSYVDSNFAKLGSQNTFTYSPQTNETIDDETEGTKLSTTQYVRDVMDEHKTDYLVLEDKVETIESKIPTEANSSNKLADKDFVNSTINSLAAFYITKNAQGDPFATYAELSSATTFYSGGQVRVPTRNDYCLVNADETHDDAACRYIYQGTQWEFQFVVNETAFTADQLASINSGITQVLVSQITNNQNAITSINAKLPRIKDFVIPINAWQLDSETGKYYAELDAGNDFVIVGNDMKNYTGTNKADTDLIMFYGIVASSNATTQKFRFECLFVEDAPDQVINYTISMYGGN